MNFQLTEVSTQVSTMYRRSAFLSVYGTGAAVDPVYTVTANYLMTAWSPDNGAAVYWESIGQPNYSPVATIPVSIVANLTNKAVAMIYTAAAANLTSGYLTDENGNYLKYEAAV